MRRACRSAKNNGDCYKAAANFILDHVGNDLRLAHGTCTGKGPIAGIAFGHAWVETDDLVFECSNGNDTVVRKADYYKLGACLNVITYTQEETSHMLLKHLHYGPWDEELQKIPNKRLTTPRALIK